MRRFSSPAHLLFQSTLPLRGATADDRGRIQSSADFNPRSPCGERPQPSAAAYPRGSISIHAPLAGSDGMGVFTQSAQLRFQSTLPLRGATPFLLPIGPMTIISIHAPLAGSDNAADKLRNLLIISIHAPLAGSDDQPDFAQDIQRNFNPRSPCGERPPGSPPRWPRSRFQSTLPLRGATHAFLSVPAKHIRFQSTLPLRGATAAPLSVPHQKPYFNPRSPCGERLRQQIQVSRIA